ncbi:MAG TPA: hypothetical protein OIM63_00085 [Bacilli bacterium]|nr:hypothetical protein [Bacilli bacterium]
MKEATGELNMSVVVISSIAILSAFFYTILWPMINENQKQQTNCSKAICTVKNPSNDVENGIIKKCYYMDNNVRHELNNVCKYKG